MAGKTSNFFQAAVPRFDTRSISFLNAKDASAVDAELMGTLAFSIDQLMELAGLAVAQAVEKVFATEGKSPKVLVLCGPQNNGGDGLVAARHLWHFGFKPTILYPRATKNELYLRLIKQCAALDIPIVQDPSSIDFGAFDMTIDALFGFGFDATRPVRAPYDVPMKEMIRHQAAVPVVSVDVPSGWDVNKGDVAKSGLLPHTLVSLTAPKGCAKLFRGPHHILGGRFIPPAIVDKYGLKLPQYPGSSQIVHIDQQAIIDLADNVNTDRPKL